MPCFDTPSNCLPLCCPLPLLSNSPLAAFTQVHSKQYTVAAVQSKLAQASQAFLHLGEVSGATKAMPCFAHAFCAPSFPLFPPLPRDSSPLPDSLLLPVVLSCKCHGQAVPRHVARGILYWTSKQKHSRLGDVSGATKAMPCFAHAFCAPPFCMTFSSVQVSPLR